MGQRDELLRARGKRVAVAVTVLGAVCAIGGGLGTLLGVSNAFQAAEGGVDPSSKAGMLAEGISTSFFMSVVAFGGLVVAGIGALLWFLARRSERASG